MEKCSDYLQELNNFLWTLLFNDRILCIWQGYSPFWRGKVLKYETFFIFWKWLNHVQELYEAIEEMFMRTDPADYQTEMRLTVDVDIAGEKKWIMRSN